MDHLAIMKKSRKLLPKILSGEKTIESRWYKSKRSPWNKIKKSERIYFKDSGEPVTLTATVEKILQFENLNPEVISAIIDEYRKELGICPEDQEKSQPKAGPPPFEGLRTPQGLERLAEKISLSEAKYCLLIFLKNVRKVKPFKINKSGFGLMSAWIAVDSIENIKKISN